MKYVERKSMPIRYSGRSSDYITPTFGHGCLYKCTYCYMRRHIPDGLSIATNTDKILEVIDNHANSLPWHKEPNQTHEKFYTYDFSCNEDYILHAKFHEWEKLFEFFKSHPKAMGTAATKYVNDNLLNFNPEGKIRIRFSLLPYLLHNLLEPKTTSSFDRMDAINRFIEAGYDVHVNFSPVIITEDYPNDYIRLFKYLDLAVSKDYKKNVKAEVIFLTHNEKMHEYNLKENNLGERWLWVPEIQEEKISTYGGKNIRYKREIKQQLIESFKKIHSEYLPWQEIRYIF
jgi:spore photoproduct lyase